MEDRKIGVSFYLGTRILRRHESDRRSIVADDHDTNVDLVFFDLLIGSWAPQRHLGRSQTPHMEFSDAHVAVRVTLKSQPGMFGCGVVETHCTCLRRCLVEEDGVT